MLPELLTDKVNWLVEEYIHDDDTSLVDKLREKGYTVKIFPHVFRLDALKMGYQTYVKQLFNDTKPVVFHGALDTAKFLSQYGGYTYRQFANFDSLHTVSYYADEALHPHLLNQYYVYLPLWKAFAMLKEDIAKPVFIRPDSPLKEFSGQVITPDASFEEFCKKNALLPSEAAKLLTMMAPTKEIRSEARFVITADEVLSGSYYRMDGEIVYKNIPTEGDSAFLAYINNLLLDEKAFNNLIAANGGVLTVDLAHVSNTGNLLLDYKVIEVGSFSTSSLYDADFDRVVDMVSLLAYRKDVGEEDVEFVHD